MTKSTEVVADFVSALAQHREQMIGVAVDLRKDEGFRQVRTGIDIRQYESGLPVIESYVDAELADGRSIGLWVEIRSDTERFILKGS